MIKVKRWELLRGLFLEERVKGLVVIPTIKRLSQDKRGGKKEPTGKTAIEFQIEFWQG